MVLANLSQSCLSLRHTSEREVCMPWWKYGEYLEPQIKLFDIVCMCVCVCCVCVFDKGAETLKADVQRAHLFASWVANNM